MNFLFIATDMAVKFYTQSAKMTRCRQQSTTSWVIVEETYLDLSIKISNCIPVDITLDAGGSYIGSWIILRIPSGLIGRHIALL